MTVCRFAPSTTGPAHPGTLLAALLCWLDARRIGARLLLRLEDLDPERCRPEWRDSIIDDLRWLGLDWDAVQIQSDGSAGHEAALDRLSDRGLLYPCRCTRSTLRAHGERAPDGSVRYPNRCRGRSLPPGGWRECGESLRVRLSPGVVSPRDEGGLDLRCDPAASFGDPVVRRRDGAVAYHLSGVVDDAAADVDRVVRGRDLAASTGVQVAVQGLLGLATPTYRHHLLLLEERGGKLAKLHGAVAASTLRERMDPQSLCGWLAFAAGLRERPDPASPQDLCRDFSWEVVRSQDRAVRWTGVRLELLG